MINHRTWVSEAADRQKWHQKIFTGTKLAEAGRREKHELIREKRKLRVT